MNYMYWLARLTDIFTTWLNYDSPRDELNPVMGWSMTRFGFGGYILVNLLISGVFYLFLLALKRPYLVRISVFLSFLVTFFNLGIYLFCAFDALPKL